MVNPIRVLPEKGKLRGVDRKIAYCWLRSKKLTDADALLALKGIDTREDLDEFMELLPESVSRAKPRRRQIRGDTFDEGFLEYRADIEREALEHYKRCF